MNAAQPVKLVLDRVTKRFGDATTGLLALDKFDLSIDENSFVALVGPSGCGKSTALNIVAGLEQASSGIIMVDGREVTGPGRDRGVVFQSYTLMPWLTVAENVEFALIDEFDKARRRVIALEHLQLVGLGDFAGHYPSQLSGGMRQRVAIARSLSYRPKVLLMDEPFGALDAMTRYQMQELLLRIWDEHKLTVLFITHDIEEAVFLADRAILMSARPGRIKLEIAIDLPRPRGNEIRTSEHFQRLKRELLSAVNAAGH
ncbi:ABC transporter ATP-binding protein [Boseaceae bacterium BT-24-1]|nr:ABC transporter ATP-binding protein [Boseaceae bacterium BT-24-1]